MYVVLYIYYKYGSKGTLHRMYAGCVMYGTNNNRTHLDTDRSLESQLLLYFRGVTQVGMKMLL